MQDYLLPLTLVGAAIVLALSIYAGWLLSKLYKQKQLQEKMLHLAITKRNDVLIESINVIAKAALSKQCDLSEAAIRLYMLMIHLQGAMRVPFPVRFPALFKLFETVKDMPRGEDRKIADKKERMRLDLVRLKSESLLEQEIFGELEDILVFTGAKDASSHA